MSRQTIYDAASQGKVKSFSDLLSPVVASTVVTKRVPNQRRLLTPDERQQLAMEEARKDGFDKGYAEGAVEGWKEGSEIGRMDGKMKAHDQASAEYRVEIDKFVASLNQVIEEIRAAVPVWYEQSEQSMTNVVVDAVKSLLATELQTSRDSALAIVQEALKEVTHARHARIRLNPFDSAILNQHREEILSATASLRDLDLIDDPNIRGGCIIETDGGIVDATVDTRLDLFEQTFEDAA